jgi:hypothetical protein
MQPKNILCDDPINESVIYLELTHNLKTPNSKCKVDVMHLHIGNFIIYP